MRACVRVWECVRACVACVCLGVCVTEIESRVNIYLIHTEVKGVNRGLQRVTEGGGGSGATLMLANF